MTGLASARPGANEASPQQGSASLTLLINRVGSSEASCCAIIPTLSPILTGLEEELE